MLQSLFFPGLKIERKKLSPLGFQERILGFPATMPALWIILQNLKALELCKLRALSKQLTHLTFSLVFNLENRKILLKNDIFYCDKREVSHVSLPGVLCELLPPLSDVMKFLQNLRSLSHYERGSLPSVTAVNLSLKTSKSYFKKLESIEESHVAHYRFVKYWLSL